MGYFRISSGTDCLFSQTRPSVHLGPSIAYTVYYPNVFELPNGNVDTSDPVVLSGLMREMLEETGLNVTRIIGEVNPFAYLTEETVNDKTGKRIVSKQCIQLNYVVEVKGGGVVINPAEHSEFIWAAKEDVADLDITEGMRGVVADVFARAAANAEQLKPGGSL